MSSDVMQIIDMHSHWGTRRGYPLQTATELAQQRATWNSEPSYHTESGMADHFRANNVRAILDLGFAKYRPLDEARALHDYAFETERAYSDVILGHWIHIDPERSGPEGVKELRRCIDKRIGFLGYAISASLSPPASDPLYAPYYKLCIEAGIPVLIFVGTTGLGAGLPGGDGVILDYCHPRHLDLVAAKYPELKIVAARPGWPWQAEVIAVLMHKRNIWYELHGWSPKYHTPDLKHEIPRRLKDRIMFGCDYPLFSYERLVKDWRAEGYPEEILTKVFHKNAERFLDEVGVARG
jgi:predicted TIM-barrel fold metal-dependent hydrolase